MRRGAGILLLTAACAHIAAPPGGPDDKVAPTLLSVTPDSVMSLPGFDGEVAFHFDEVVNEGTQPNFGLGTGTLEKLILLSPSVEVPKVGWHRDRITVSPKEGWQPNTVYRVELLAGVQDLRNNKMEEGAVTTFTTGDAVPTDSLYGRVINWTTRRAVAVALVEAILMPDSLPYRAQTDSTGRFTLGPLPEGEYLVYGVVDQNRDFRRDRREDFDSLRMAVGTDSVGELWTFRHDSLPPRISSLNSQDSLTIVVTFSASLDPYQVTDPDSVRVLTLPDSVAVPVTAVLPREVFDSVFAPVDTAADSTRADSAAAPPTTPDTVEATPLPTGPGPPPPPLQAPTDTTEADSALVDVGPFTTRPQLFEQLYIRVSEPLAPDTRYYVQVFGVRSLSGTTGEPFLVLRTDSIPEPPQDTAAAARDTAAIDTTAASRDTNAVLRDTTGVDTSRVTLPLTLVRPPRRPRVEKTPR